jgi:hypothetical protein
MWFRVLVSVLVGATTLLAEGPGVMVEGAVSLIAQDADGTLWGANEVHGTDLFVLTGRKWEKRDVSGLNENCRHAVVETLADGDVGILWRDSSDGESDWVLTRHRADRSRIAARFRATLQEPALHGFSDGRVLITESGRTAVLISPADGKAEVRTLPENTFFPPEKKQADGSLSTEFAPVRALGDGAGTFWLWSPARERQEYRWRLGGLVQVSVNPWRLKLHHVGEQKPAVSACVPWDEKHLAVAVAGEGPLLLPEGGTEFKRMVVPNEATFRHVEQMFHDGAAWHAVTEPRPTKTDFSAAPDLGNRFLIRQTFYYDRSKPACAIWRHEKGKWRLLHDGLDKEPAGQRSWLRTKQGLFLGSDAGAPWLLPADGGKPRRLASDSAFPLTNVGRMFAVDEKQVLLVSRHGGSACLWPADAPFTGERAQRWEAILTEQAALQDQRGRIWCLRKDGTFARWDGKVWTNFPPPPGGLAMGALAFIPDDRDRGWLLPLDDAPTAICDFATGKWSTFKTLREALVAQLPQGAKLRVPEHPFCEHAFSGDGRIGAFVGTNKILHYENRRWREWALRDFAGADARLGGTPFFAADGKFSVPVGEGTAWQWNGEPKGWERAEGVVVPNPGTGPVHAAVALPDGSEFTSGDSDRSGAQDRNGVIWLLRKGGALFKVLPGREVRVFDEDELNPFRHPRTIYRALADDAGNVLLDTSQFSSDHQHIFIRARQPVPKSVAVLTANSEDTVRIAVGEKGAAPLWHTWRVDGGPLQPLREGNELTIDGLLPGKHTVEVRAFNAELTPAASTARVEFVTSPSAEAQFAGSIRELASVDLDVRETAARKLKSQGRAALPRLREARAGASADAQWWLDAIIQHIERQPAPVAP